MESLIKSLLFVVFVFESAEEFRRSPGVDDSGCLVIDVRMRGMSGFDLQDRLIAQGSRIPIILIAGFPNKPFEVARNLGARSLASKSHLADGP